MGLSEQLMLEQLREIKKSSRAVYQAWDKTKAIKIQYVGAQASATAEVVIVISKLTCPGDLWKALANSGNRGCGACRARNAQNPARLTAIVFCVSRTKDKPWALGKTRVRERILLVLCGGHYLYNI